MSITFTKLFSSITESTIWCESPETKVVWITMLAKSDQYGRVFTSIPGLAKLAGVSVNATRAAIHLFLEPDADSRTKDHEGRRICEIDGGYGLLNHEKYREIRDSEERKEYKRVWAANKRAEEKAETVDNSVDKSGQSRPQSTHTDTDTDTDQKTCRAVLDYLNKKSGKNFHHVDANLKPIKARLKQYDKKTVKAVIDSKCEEWLNTDMEYCVRPKTIFGSENFAQYSGQLGTSKKNDYTKGAI